MDMLSGLSLYKSDAVSASQNDVNPLVEAGESFIAALSRAETTAQSAMMGRADSQALVEALAASEIAVETVVTVRDRVVEAYNEIMRMPV